MPKKIDVKTVIDTDLDDLYTKASDFGEKYKVMELRIEYEKVKIKANGGAGADPVFFDEEGDK